MSELLSSEMAGGRRSAGELIREARLAQETSLDTLAASLKVPQRKLEALEASRWDELRDATFARALAQTVCRALRVEPAPVLALMPGATSKALSDWSTGINEPFVDRLSESGGPLRQVLLRPMVWASVMIVLAAALIYAWPDQANAPWDGEVGAESDAKPETEPAEPAGDLPPVASVAVSPSPSVAFPAPVASSAVAVGPSGASSATTPSASLPPAQPRSDSLSATPLSSGGGVNAASTLAPVEFFAEQEAWIQVKDAQGQVLLSRMLKGGERVQLQGMPPLQAVVGNAAFVRVSVRGVPFDLKPLTRDNVARPELK